MSGSGFGCYAEYVCARENALTLKPASLTFEQAAAVPQAGVLATLGLRRRGEIQPGQNVLVNGAGGGAGSFAVQIAKAFEAEVTGVDNTVKQDMMTSIGADHAIDYTKEDFTRNGQRYDYILDNAAHHSIFAYRCSLASGGTYVMLGGSMGRILQGAVVGPIMSLIGSKKLGLLMLRANRDLDFLMELIETGKVEPVIDKTYPLSELAEAFRRFGKGHALGKLVITV